MLVKLPGALLPGSQNVCLQIALLQMFQNLSKSIYTFIQKNKIKTHITTQYPKFWKIDRKKTPLSLFINLMSVEHLNLSELKKGSEWFDSSWISAMRAENGFWGAEPQNF